MSTVILARAVTQIIHVYSQLASYGYLNPSWPQLRRISVCGHLFILLTSSGEFGLVEANHLLRHFLPLLDGHVALWPVVRDMKSAYCKAAQLLGEDFTCPSGYVQLTVPGLTVPETNEATDATSHALGSGPLLGGDDNAAWQDLSLMFDPTFFLSMTHDELAG